VVFLFFFFFFQAEDGIRDRTVTGVQTCALPIFGVPLVHALDEQRTEFLAEPDDRPRLGVNLALEDRRHHVVRPPDLVDPGADVPLDPVDDPGDVERAYVLTKPFYQRRIEYLNPL